MHFRVKIIDVIGYLIFKVLIASKVTILLLSITCYRKINCHQITQNYTITGFHLIYDIQFGCQGSFRSPRETTTFGNRIPLIELTINQKIKVNVVPLPMT